VSEDPKVESFRPSVDLPNIMLMCAQEMKSPGISIGFQMALTSLKRILAQASEIGDEVILDELKHIGIEANENFSDDPTS
jgi:hypothetical protein